MGSYHTIELAIQRKFTLAKHEWDSLAIERLNTACDPTKTADLAAVLMHQGLANLCIVTPFVFNIHYQLFFVIYINFIDF